MLRNKIQKLHSVEHVDLFGNATTAIYVALKAAGLFNELVAVPANACFNVVQAVLASNNIPILVDVCPETQCVSLDHLSAEFRGLIGIHAYGRTLNVEEIKTFCSDNEIIFIEDCAVAQGSMISGNPVGSFGDFSVLSFGRGKIIDVGHGGALATNNSYFADKVQKVKLENMEQKERKDDFLSVLFNQAYNKLVFYNDDSFCQKFFVALQKSKRSFICSFDLSAENTVLKCLENLENNLEIRKKNVQRFQKLFANDDRLKISEHNSDETYWRLNIFLHQETRNNVLRRLLEKGEKISSWYPSLHNFLPDVTKFSSLENTQKISEEILNLWINEEVDEKYFESVFETIMEAF